MNERRYSELIRFETFEERLRYLMLNGIVCDRTFGGNRYLNQAFYSKDPEWLQARDYVIVRDKACDLASYDHPINDIVINGKILKPKILVHHINPLTIEDILNRTKYLLDPDYLVCTIKNTHDIIHYGNDNSIKEKFVAREKNDTSPWLR